MLTDVPVQQVNHPVIINQLYITLRVHHDVRRLDVRQLKPAPPQEEHGFKDLTEDMQSQVARTGLENCRKVHICRIFVALKVTPRGQFPHLSQHRLVVEGHISKAEAVDRNKVALAWMVLLQALDESAVPSTSEDHASFVNMFVKKIHAHLISH